MEFILVQIVILSLCLTQSGVSGSGCPRAGPQRTARSPDGEDLLPKPDEEPEAKEDKTPVGQLYLPPDYNKYEIPSRLIGDMTELGSIIVRVHIRIREIGDLDELDEKFSASMDVRLWWTDDVLFNAVQKKINPSGEGVSINFRRKRDNDEPEESKRKKLDPSFLKQIWKPDLFIDGLISTSNPAFIAKPEKLVFRQDGVLVLQSRVSLTISCNMDFHYYPADTQECTFSIRSYAFESHELELEWGSPSPSVYAFDRRNTNFEIQLLEPKMDRLVEPSLEEPEVSISWGDTTYTAPQKNETFDVLTFSIRARRRMAYHLVQTYLPSIFFILITWLCFLIPPHMVECRIGITMTTLLTLTAMFASVRESTPIVSYVKAIDIWMIACIFFVFLTLLQFSFVVWLGLNKPPPDEPEEETSVRKMNVTGEIEGYELGERLKGPSSSVDKLSADSVQIRTFRNAIRLERLSILLYVFLFLVFNAIYWPWLLNSSKYFDWVVDPTYNAPDADE